MIPPAGTDEAPTTGGPRVSILVQHHPRRAHLLPALLDRLGPDAIVVTDPRPNSPNPSPLRCYLECLRSAPAEASHVVVIQDDSIPIQYFADRVRERIAERPDSMIAYFTPGTGVHRNDVLRAASQGRTWARLRVDTWQPTVALGWRADLIPGMLAYAERYDVEKTRGDDMPVGRYLGSIREPVWATVPSLVEHPDVEPSLIRPRAAKAGQNRARVAAVPPSG